MGIVKIRHQGPGDCNHAQKDISTITLSDLKQEERLLLGKDYSDEYDDFCELAEVDCECAMVGGQICNVPYQIYDLPDLKDVLSLDTWNSCLTEDEKFSLAIYLPDMDEQTFWIAMNELLYGAKIFFGSPLGTFFNRLKGGFYSPKVTRFREGLQFLQRQQYYHHLRSYHESLTQKFVHMKRAWSDIQPNISIEERVRIWNNRKNHKPVFLVDLNAIPSDEDNASKGDKSDTTIPLFKKKRIMNEGVNAHVSSIVLDGVAVNTKAKAKGVLKIKPIERNSMQNHIVQQLQSNSVAPCWRRPKGVLKIKPKHEPLSQERQSTLQIPAEQPLADLAGVQNSGSVPTQFCAKWHEEAFSSHLPFQHHTVTDGKASICLELPELTKSHESLNMVSGLTKNLQNSQVKIRMVKDMRLHKASEIQDKIFPLKKNHKSRKCSHKVDRSGEYCSAENLCLNSSQPSRVHCRSLTDTYPCAPENHQRRRQMTPVHLTVSEAISSISTVGTDMPQMFPKSFDHLEHKHDLNDAGFKTPSFHVVVSGVQREHLMFPITYKRKKPYQELNKVNFLKQAPMVSKLESVHHLNGKEKSLRIKVKGWNDYNAQYTQGS